MNVGEYLKSLRLSRGLTLEEVGNAVGVGKSTVRKWETGAIANMRKDKVQKLASVLGISPLDIINYEAPDVIPSAPDNPPLNLSDTQQELIQMMGRLSEDDQRKLLRIVRAAFPSEED